MRHLKSLTAAMLGASMLGGCSFALNEARDSEPSGTAFARALHKGYVQLAQRELDENDFADAHVFALRARSAAAGDPEAPEQPALRALPPQHRTALSDAHARLSAAFDAGARTKSPQRAATAQLMFECWAQEQEENFQAEDIAACRDRFETTMASLSATLQPATARTAPSDGRLIKASLRTTAPSAPKTTFTVLFDLDTAVIKQASRRVIGQAIAAARLLGATAIKVSGHADRAGPSDYNRRLSARRADAVADLLKREDGAPTKIETRALGENEPAVRTPDGVKEPRNRRVEIELVE